MRNPVGKKKLALSPLTVRVLDRRELGRVAGGATDEFACAGAGTYSCASCGCKPKLG